MRDLRLLDQYRVPMPGGSDLAPRLEGAFVLPNLQGGHTTELRVIASVGDGWDHVSVSLEYRCPTWAEMERVKRLFFGDDETAMQLHVPPSQHVDCHPHCLHLWRPLQGAIPRPHSSLVGAS